MIYQLSKNFTQIAETTGTIQNTSHIYTLEMSPSNVKDSGIFIYPLQTKSFSNQTIYLRCVDGAGAEARVIPFELVTEGGDMQAVANALHDVSHDNGSLAFLNAAGQVVKYINLPEEIYLRSVGTTFVSNFTWNAQSYPNTTNPNLNGKPVLVLHVKGDSLNNPYDNYFFINFGDIINSKADKVSNATAGNIATLDQNGNLVDSGYSLTASPDISGFQAALRQSFGFTT